MVQNLALAAIIGLFAASAVVAHTDAKKEETTVPAENKEEGNKAEHKEENKEEKK